MLSLNGDAAFSCACEPIPVEKSVHDNTDSLEFLHCTCTERHRSKNVLLSSISVCGMQITNALLPVRIVANLGLLTWFLAVHRLVYYCHGKHCIFTLYNECALFSKYLQSWARGMGWGTISIPSLSSWSLPSNGG